MLTTTSPNYTEIVVAYLCQTGNIAGLEPSAEWFIIIGLLIDILAAIILLVPDSSLFSHHTSGGQMAAAKNKLNSGALRPNDTGFENFTIFLQDIEAAHRYARIDPSDGDVITIGRYLSPPDSSAADDLNWGNEYIEVHETESKNWAQVDYYLNTQVQRELDQVIQSWESRVRAAGIILLVIGFILQLIGTVV